MTLEQLISHRFRGFSKHENSLRGLKAALDFGVLNLEFDIRIARCGTAMIYHDEYAHDAGQNRHWLCHIMAKDYPKLGGDFAHMPTAEALLATFASHRNIKARLFVDIKDTGFETEIHALISFYRLQKRVIYVSWLPECLYHLHHIAPDIPLCLSYWCQNPDAAIRAQHKVFTTTDRQSLSTSTDYVTGQSSGCYVDGMVQGDMRDILRASKGAVCVPKNMVSRDLVSAYHADEILVSSFSYTDWNSIRESKARMNIDMYFIDSKDIFKTL